MFFLAGFGEFMEQIVLQKITSCKVYEKAHILLKEILIRLFYTFNTNIYYYIHLYTIYIKYLSNGISINIIPLPKLKNARLLLFKVVNTT